MGERSSSTDLWSSSSSRSRPRGVHGGAGEEGDFQNSKSATIVQCAGLRPSLLFSKLKFKFLIGRDQYGVVDVAGSSKFSLRSNGRGKTVVPSYLYDDSRVCFVFT